MSNKNKKLTKFKNWSQMDKVRMEYEDDLGLSIPALPYFHSFCIDVDGSFMIHHATSLTPEEAAVLATALYNFYCTGTGKC